MSRTPDELLDEALALPADARAGLAQSLIASLDDADEEIDPAEIERAWLAEARRRAEEIDAGAVEARPAADVFRAAREELRDLRMRRRRAG
ncbi:MAG: addiction module protein [Gemmatimonadota bacterium]|nr:addiction module protein [Gemmatimonadota bacterium]